VVAQVLDELGIEVGAMAPVAPTGSATGASVVSSAAPISQPTLVASDPGMDELEARLNNLRK
jgi:hypothetical protein